MANPTQSRNELLGMIKREQTVSFDQIRQFAKRPDIYFGPGIGVVDVLLANRDLGKLVIDVNNQSIRICKTINGRFK